MDDKFVFQYSTFEHVYTLLTTLGCYLNTIYTNNQESHDDCQQYRKSLNPTFTMVKRFLLEQGLTNDSAGIAMETNGDSILPTVVAAAADDDQGLTEDPAVMVMEMDGDSILPVAAADDGQGLTQDPAVIAMKKDGS